MSLARLILWGIILLSLILTFWLKPDLIRFWPFTATEFVQLIMPLVLVALIIERALEVLLTSWRGPAATKIAREITRLKTTEAAREQLEQARDSQVDYKSDTQRIAFLASFTLGIVISALGIRVLELFVDPDVFRELLPTQKNAFNTMDVLLTGALLGGGSEALHKLVLVFTNFMDTAAKRAKGETE